MGEKNVKNIIVDIGNTHVSFLFINKTGEKETIICHSRPEIVKAKKTIFASLENETGFLLVSSVNSFFLKEVKACFSDTKAFSIEVLTSSEFKFRLKELGFSIPNLDLLATDLLFDVIACDKATLIADYGTASKLLFVNSKKEYLGGMIGAGLKSINRSLSASAELIDEVPIFVPDDYISLTTKEAINDSTVFGECMKIIKLKEILTKDYKESGIQLVITGGDGIYLKEGFEKLGYKDFDYDPQHIFKGMLKGLKIDVSDLKGII